MACCQFHSEIDRCDHAIRLRESLAGNIKRSAVIRAGSRKWESQGDVYAFVKRMQLQWDQSLIVIHTKYRVEFAFNGAMKNRVWRVWPGYFGLPATAGELLSDFGFQRRDSGTDDIDFFASDLA